MKYIWVLLNVALVGCASHSPEFNAYKKIEKASLYIYPSKAEDIAIERRYMEFDFRNKFKIDSVGDYRSKLAEFFNENFKYIFSKWKQKFEYVDSKKMDEKSESVNIDTVLCRGELTEERAKYSFPDGSELNKENIKSQFILYANDIRYGLDSILTDKNYFPSVALIRLDSRGSIPSELYFYVKFKYIIFDLNKGKVVQVGSLRSCLSVGKYSKKIPWEDLSKEAGYSVLKDSPFYEYQADTIMYNIEPPQL